MAGKKISPERVLKELAAIGFAKATNFLCIENNELIIRSTQELSREDKAAIASIERTSSGIRVKFYDKMKALELLGKQMRLFDDREPEQNQQNNLLEAILAATQEELDIHDIPEIQQAADPGDDLVEQTGT